MYEDIFRIANNLFDNDFITYYTWDSPKADIIEEQDKYIVIMDLPSVPKDKIDISYKEKVLTISAKTEKEVSDKKYVLKQREGTSFEKSYRLKRIVDEKKITASMNNGVLTIELPFNTEKEAITKITIS